MASPGQYPITVHRFATWTLPITWTDEDGTPISTVGYTGRMQVRDAAGTLVIELTTANARISVGASITLSLSDDLTGALTAGSYQYDLLLTAAGGQTTKLLQGTFTVEDTITHA